MKGKEKRIQEGVYAFIGTAGSRAAQQLLPPRLVRRVHRNSVSQAQPSLTLERHASKQRRRLAHVLHLLRSQLQHQRRQQRVRGQLRCLGCHLLHRRRLLRLLCLLCPLHRLLRLLRRHRGGRCRGGAEPHVDAGADFGCAPAVAALLERAVLAALGHAVGTLPRLLQAEVGGWQNVGGGTGQDTSQTS